MLRNESLHGRVPGEGIEAAQILEVPDGREGVHRLRRTIVGGQSHVLAAPEVGDEPGCRTRCDELPAKRWPLPGQGLRAEPVEGDVPDHGLPPVPAEGETARDLAVAGSRA